MEWIVKTYDNSKEVCPRSACHTLHGCPYKAAPCPKFTGTCGIWTGSPCNSQSCIIRW